MAAKSTLENLTIARPIEERSPLFEFPHAFRRLLRVNLGHAPVIEKLAATHGVAEVSAPVIGRVDIGHRRGDAAFRHYSVRFAQQRFANDADSRALGECFNRCPQTGASCADDQNVVFVCFVFFRHSSRRS
jgi:hypothetical protein